MLRPEHPPSTDYVPGPEYPEYLVPSDDEASIEDQPLPADASPTALSPGYDGKEEHLAPADSTTLHVVDPVPSAEDTEAFETDESAPTPTHTRPTYAKAPLAATEALIIVVDVALPSSPPPSPLTSLSQIPSPPLPLPTPSSPFLLLATDHMEDVGEISTAAARQPELDVTPATDYSFVDNVDATPRRPMSREVGYGIMDVWDDMVRDIEGRAPTTLEELSQRVTDLAATLARDTHETRLTASLGRIHTLEAREPVRTNDPADAGSSC
nr:hypothetical protein [Tanacetum cinerariifolium]